MRLDQEYVITVFSSAHAGAVAELIGQSLQESLEQPDEAELAAWATRYSKEALVQQLNERMAFIAVIHHRVVGVILLGTDMEERFIEALVVAPEHRDAGVGAMLVETAEARLEELGCKRLTVSDKLKDNGFFRRLGYSQVELQSKLVKELV